MKHEPPVESDRKAKAKREPTRAKWRKRPSSAVGPSTPCSACVGVSSYGYDATTAPPCRLADSTNGLRTIHAIMASVSGSRPSTWPRSGNGFFIWSFVGLVSRIGTRYLSVARGRESRRSGKLRLRSTLLAFSRPDA